MADVMPNHRELRGWRRTRELSDRGTAAPGAAGLRHGTASPSLRHQTRALIIGRP